MKTDCRRWIELDDRFAVGDELSDAEASFRREHPVRCAECGREADLWRSVENLAEPRPAGGARDGRSAPRRVVGLEGGPRMRSVGAAVLALALAAAVALLVRARDARVDGLRVAKANVGLVSGTVWIDGVLARAGAAVTQGAIIHGDGSVCLNVEPAVSACIEAGSVARVGDLTLAHRVIELRKGRVTASLAHQPEGTRFSVATPLGSATAIGTAFTVDVPGGSAGVVVHVEHGVVLVSATSGQEVRVGAGQETVMGSGRVAQAARESRPMPAPAVATAVSAPAVPPPVPPPPAPVAARSNPAVVEPAPRHPSAGELLEQARSRRAANPREAAALYKRLEVDYPDSPEARASLVSLGDISLALGDAAGALAAYDRYVTGGGDVAEEARYGRVHALRALGRMDDERAAIVAFLADYPTTLHGEALRARLLEISPQ